MAVLGAGLVVVSLAPAAGTEAAFTAPTTNPGNAFTARADWRAPITTRFEIAKTTAGGVPVGHPGFVRSGGTYRFVSDTIDDPSSNPPAGVGAVTGAVPVVAITAAMPATALTVAGLAYTRASAVQTAPMAYPGVNSIGDMTLNATDTATPANAAAVFDSTVVLDNVALAATALTITNGGVAGRPDAGDVLDFTWNDVVDSYSVQAGWSGAAPSTVTVTIAANDTLTVGGTNLGSVATGADYVVAATTYTGSTMTWRLIAPIGVRVVLGAPSATATTRGNATHTWTPSVAVTDRAGNPSSAVGLAEGGAADPNF